MSNQIYIELVSCCDPTIILNFKKPSMFEVFSSSYQYLGPTENGLVNNACYTITQKSGSISFILGLPEVNATYFTNRTGCNDAKCICDTPCYTLYACDGSNFNTTTDLSANVGTYIRIEDDPKTWYVIEDPTKKNCNNTIDIVLDTISTKTPCVLTCYQVTGTPASVTYMDSNYNIITAIGAIKVCSYITPIVTGPTTGYVLELGLCVDEICPEICFKFTNCQTGEILVVSNTPSIIPYYAQEQIVTLQGYEGCWTIDIADNCDCPVSVTILTAYNGPDCTACLPTVAYKFTSCDNQSIIRYSTDDYSAYVGKTVELECGGCWFVSEIDFIPPSTQDIDILYTFDSCAACAKTYYKLTNCSDDTDIIYTDSVLNLPLNQTSTFDVISSPTDCECIKINYQLIGGNSQSFTTNSLGLDINGYNYYSFTIPGVTFPYNLFQDPKGWQLENQAQPNIYEFALPGFAECPFGVYESIGLLSPLEAFSVEPCPVTKTVISIKECPGCFEVEVTREPVNTTSVTLVEIYTTCEECSILPPTPTPVEEKPKRKIKPGYSVPTCDIDTYEKITCKSSEILYKQVLQLRYGISNCCPEEDAKWLIKKELIDLVSLIDPDYICKPVTSCCNQPINDCGCNTLKTCNSQ